MLLSGNNHNIATKENTVYLTSEEIEELISGGLDDAEQELQDNGLSLTVECTTKNGDGVTTKAYGKRIDNGSYNKSDIERHDRLKKLTGIAS